MWETPCDEVFIERASPKLESQSRSSTDSCVVSVSEGAGLEDSGPEVGKYRRSCLHPTLEVRTDCDYIEHRACIEFETA
jgi:hypothetical protein